MVLPLITIALLSLAALIGLWRRRKRGALGITRWFFILLAQPLLSVLLYFALFPTTTDTPTASMTVYTADAEAMPASTGFAVALPEAPQTLTAARMPDLATALRRYPHVQHLHIVGTGLEARDRDSAQHYSLRLHTQAQPKGIVALQTAQTVALGNVYRLSGRVAGMANAKLELFDPAGQRVQQVIPDQEGRFHLQAIARAPGLSEFSLRLLDANDVVQETLTLPLQVTTATPPRLLVLATSPNPELKYLRRWAVDAGLPLHSRIGAGAGLMLGDAPITLTADTLRGFDSVLLDQRSLSALSEPEFRALHTAIEEGLGLVVRLDSAVSAAEKQRLSRLGLTLTIGTQPRAFIPMPQPSLITSTAEAALELQHLPLSAPSTSLVPFINDRAGQPAGYWRMLKRGRVAVISLLDSYSLVLNGQTTQHANLWSNAIAHVARPLASTDAPAIDLPSMTQHPAWQGDRIALCGLADTAEVITPEQTRVPVYVDPRTGNNRCAAFWSTQSGWHFVATASQQQAFYLWAEHEAKALRLQHTLDATRALVDPRLSFDSNATSSKQPQRPWIWLLAWLLVASAVWWAERRQVAPARH